MFAPKEPKATEVSGRQEAILVFEDRTTANGACPRIKDVVDKIHSALMVVFSLIRKPDRHRILNIAGQLSPAGCGKPLVAQEIGFAAIDTK